MSFLNDEPYEANEECTLQGCTCVIATAELNEQVEKELKILDPSFEIAIAAIHNNTLQKEKVKDEF